MVWTNHQLIGPSGSENGDFDLIWAQLFGGNMGFLQTQQHILVHSTDLSKSALLFSSTFFVESDMSRFPSGTKTDFLSLFSRKFEFCPAGTLNKCHTEFHFCFHTAVVYFQDHMLSTSMGQLTSRLSIYYRKGNGDK